MLDFACFPAKDSGVSFKCPGQIGKPNDGAADWDFQNNLTHGTTSNVLRSECFVEGWAILRRKLKKDGFVKNPTGRT